MILAIVGVGAATASGQTVRPDLSDGTLSQGVFLEGERFRAGGGDMTPLTGYYLDASRSVGDARASVSMARLAAAASPGDPRAHAELLRLALLRRFDVGEAAHEFWQTFRAVLSDPWFLSIFALKLPSVLALGALLSAFAILLCLLPRFGPCLFHDFSDVLPVRLRRFTPIAVLCLAVVAALAVGVGPLLMLLGLALAVLPYPRAQSRWALALCLAVACGAWSGLDRLSRISGDVGQRAWAYYRVQKGDWGAKLEAELVQRFDARDPDGLLARSAVARRAGRYEQATDLLLAAIRAGADEGSARIELGNLFFLKGQLREAETEYGRSAAASPHSAIPWLNLHVLYLKQIQLAEADKALENARSLDAGAVEQFQRGYRGGRGSLLPETVPLGGDRVFTDLLFGRGGAAGWSDVLAGSLFAAFWGLRPFYFGFLCLVVAFLASNTGGGRHSHRCPSCGAVVCPRCRRRVKSVETCSACWALTNQQGADSAEKERQRLLVVRWRARGKRYGQVIRWVAPGWSDFTLAGSWLGLAVGVVWGGAGGAILLNALYPVPLFAWGGGAPWLAWTVVVLCHLYGVKRAGSALRSRMRS